MGNVLRFFQPGYADEADLLFVCGSRDIDEINFCYRKKDRFHERYSIIQGTQSRQ